MKIRQTLESIARGVALASVLAVGGCTAPKQYDNAIYSESFHDLTAKTTSGEVDINGDGLPDQYLSQRGIDLRVSKSAKGEAMADWGRVRFEYLPDGKTFKMHLSSKGGMIRRDNVKFSPNVASRLYPVEDFMFESPVDMTIDDYTSAEGYDELNKEGHLIRRVINYPDHFPKFSGLTREEYFDKTGKMTQATIENRDKKVLWAIQFNPITENYDIQLDNLDLANPPSK